MLCSRNLLSRPGGGARTREGAHGSPTLTINPSLSPQRDPPKIGSKKKTHCSSYSLARVRMENQKGDGEKSAVIRPSSHQWIVLSMNSAWQSLTHLLCGKLLSGVLTSHLTWPKLLTSLAFKRWWELLQRFYSSPSPVICMLELSGCER